MGWLLVMFDLPVVADSERKRAAAFRKFLLDDGYSMMQFSIYMRFCSSYDKMKKHVHRLKPRIPVGDVKSIYITDKQWATAINLVGKDYSHNSRRENPEQLKLFEFW